MQRLNMDMSKECRVSMSCTNDEESSVDSIEDKLRTSFEDKFGSRPELDDGLAYIGVDSIGMAELTVELERDFGIKVGDDIVSVDTVKDLADYIRERLESNAK